MKYRHKLRQVAASWLEGRPVLRRIAAAADRRLDSLRHSIGRLHPALIRPQPSNLTVALTAQCNLRCKGCRYGRDFMPGEQLEWPVLRELLDDAHRAGFLSVRLYGGEPLLHPELARTGEYAASLGLRPYVTTNAQLLGERIDELVGAGLREFTVGFYGSEESYDGYVQRRGAFRRLERSIATVRERHGDEVGLRMNWLLMRPTCNREALEAAWSFAQRYAMTIQVDLIHYSLPYFSEGPERELQFRAEDRPAIERLVDALVQLKEAHPEMLNHSPQGLRSIPDWLIRGPRMQVPCDKYHMIWVGANGAVQLCYVTFELGNLHEKRLSRMLFDAGHCEAARRCIALDCPNCHCGYDTRILKDGPSRRRYSRELTPSLAGSSR